jgi:hypothetical protein
MAYAGPPAALRTPAHVRCAPVKPPGERVSKSGPAAPAIAPLTVAPVRALLTPTGVEGDISALRHNQDDDVPLPGAAPSPTEQKQRRRRRPCSPASSPLTPSRRPDQPTVRRIRIYRCTKPCGLSRLISRIFSLILAFNEVSSVDGYRE